MPSDIGDYALIGDCHTGALVGRDGSIDWLCAPRFDSASMFGAILGESDHGHWRIAPVGTSRDGILCTSRRYDGDTFVLVTTWVVDNDESGHGEVEVTDFMPIGDRRADVVRRVRGIRGEVHMEQVMRIRFDYADSVPWMRQTPEHDGPGENNGLGSHALVAVAGPDAAIVRGPRFEAADHEHRTDFVIREGETVDTTMTWFPSHRQPPAPLDQDAQLDRTLAWWRNWISTSEEPGVHDAAVRRSLLVLRALTHADTGGIIAALTTSLPEDEGGERNWDYRYVWLRDAALTLEALMLHGYGSEAAEWRDWLLRAIAGDPADVQIMYGIAGERRLTETTIETLPGYRGASPVRVGNGAFDQYQGDIFGEVMLALQQARQIGVEENRFSWSLQVALLDYLETVWERPDNGIWEIRGPLRYFTHSRVMIWAAFDCGIRAARDYDLDGPVDRWIEVRDRIREEIDARGVDPATGAFRQHYDTTEVDASLLMIAHTGFAGHDDPRMLATVARMEDDLLRDGLTLRYRTETGVDGLEGDEHPFLACSFWLVEQYAATGRIADAEALMSRLVGFSNDVGLLSEEYDIDTEQQMGNTPQALSHLALVRAADSVAQALERHRGAQAA
ncbi:MAG: glycoside hydrolase family 15 protein [Microbacteriaceae bacterium]